MKKSITKYIKMAIPYVAILLIAYIVSVFFYQLALVTGDSMYPTLHNNQLIIIDKYHKNYTYDDIVIFKSEKLKRHLIKRVIAVPGDTVYIKDEKLYVNDTLCETYKDTSFSYVGILSEPVHLDEDSYFAIGDNTEVSKDSRYSDVGCINIKNINGKILQRKK